MRFLVLGDVLTALENFSAFAAAIFVGRHHAIGCQGLGSTELINRCHLERWFSVPEIGAALFMTTLSECVPTMQLLRKVWLSSRCEFTCLDDAVIMRLRVWVSDRSCSQVNKLREGRSNV